MSSESLFFGFSLLVIVIAVLQLLIHNGMVQIERTYQAVDITLRFRFSIAKIRRAISNSSDEGLRTQLRFIVRLIWFSRILAYILVVLLIIWFVTPE